MKKPFIVVLALICSVIVLAAFTKDEPRYKNLKVLPKNIQKRQMDSVMNTFTAALGVKCNFCHVRLEDEQKTWDFASDNNNHKKIARDMMRMTQKLNQKYFDVKNAKSLTADLEVTCYTCHNGKAHPAIKFTPPPRQQNDGDTSRRKQ
jgi:Na+-transporting NADH:ubiquinone oxidoreductase subunit NqrC